MSEHSGTPKRVGLAAVEKWYGNVPAVQALDLEADPGEFVVLLGPSGCGKTTVLRMIAGLEEPTRGDIRIGEISVVDVEPADRDIAMVFQNYALYPHMTVRQNLGFGLKMRRIQRREIQDRVLSSAGVLGLDTLLDRRPEQLSGGQRQRVALGRALVRKPSVFLFDEPLSNLDARLRLEMRSEIARLHRETGTTMIYVTHDQIEAMTLGDRIAVMNQGKLQQYASPLHVYRCPANLFVATFIGSPPINTAVGHLFTERSCSVFKTTGMQLDLPPYGFEGEVVLGVRPEALSLVRNVHDVEFLAKVSRLEPLGNELLVHLNGPGEHEWVTRANPDTECSVGESLGVSIDLSRTHLFAGPEKKRLSPVS